MQFEPTNFTLSISLTRSSWWLLSTLTSSSQGSVTNWSKAPSLRCRAALVSWTCDSIVDLFHLRKIFSQLLYYSFNLLLQHTRVITIPKPLVVFVMHEELV